MTAQFILDDKTFVVLPLEEYEELRQLAEDADDEVWAAQVWREREAARAADEYVAMTKEAWARIRANESPVRVIREHRGLTQVALAEKSGIAQPEISAIEGKTRIGTAATFKALAKALGVPMDILVGEE